LRQGCLRAQNGAQDGKASDEGDHPHWSILFQRPLITFLWQVAEHNPLGGSDLPQRTEGGGERQQSLKAQRPSHGTESPRSMMRQSREGASALIQKVNPLKGPAL
jgi:hypothetical protein